MFRKYVRFLLTNICSYSIFKSETEQRFGKHVRLKVLWIQGDIKMTVQERTRRSRIKRRRQVAKQKLVLLIATVFVITIGSIGFGSFFSSAKTVKSDVPMYKYYKSIIIKEGDSLWSIANEYNHNKVDNHEYVNELKELNGLTSETIQAGQHLLITYYDTEVR